MYKRQGARVVECGTGSGSLTTAFAHFVGDEGCVYSYDAREEFVELARRNCRKWGVEHRVEFNVRHLSQGFEETDVDAVFLDLPDPWNYLLQVRSALALGRRMGALLPTFNQIEKFLRALEENYFVDIEVLEIFLRKLRIDPDRIRPVSYTHLDVYKRQSLRLEDAFRTPIEDGCYGHKKSKLQNYPQRANAQAV